MYDDILGKKKSKYPDDNFDPIKQGWIDEVRVKSMSKAVSDKIERLRKSDYQLD